MKAYEMARKNAVFSIRNFEPITKEVIDNTLAAVINMVKSLIPEETVDVDMLRRELMTHFNVWSEDSTELIDNTDHEPWLSDKKSAIQWKFWNRYQQYLEEEKNIPEQVILRTNGLTDKILGYMEEPQRKGVWDRRGMVVGDVQSGKTSNYTGLICKAVDAGYKIVIVLAGLHSSLRSQTQLRLDEGFLGFDTQTSLEFNQHNRRLFGAGKLQEHGDLIVHSLTSSAESGDYKATTARTVNFMLGGDPVLLVVKKNATILKHVLKWLHSRGKKDSVTGVVSIDGIPLLLIDDEADNASIDGKNVRKEDIDEGYEPTAINKAIRQILKTFKQSAYVGYTATPFANIFIYPPDEQSDKNKYGEDLFPRSFIINLPAPSNYVGPAQVFGLNGDPENGLEAADGLPIVKRIYDNEEFIPSSHPRTYIPKQLPDSLKRAIRVFILSCTARMMRGQANEHNSMLIHVTRLNQVQREITDLVMQELGSIQKRFDIPTVKTEELIHELKVLWDEEFVPVTAEIMTKVDDEMIQPINWKDMKSKLYEAVAKIQVREINGTAGDVLDYRNHKNGLSVIAIGGDKLSRGLTLEGLTVSYYLRASKMYDTLLQMGRWFGYRPGYLDLCRIYTTKELTEWYKHIASANEELRMEFDFMAASGGTPDKYGLKVRTHPEGLQITAANKLRHGTLMKVTFGGQLVETAAFFKSDEINKKNLTLTTGWLETLPAPVREKDNNLVWRQVKPQQVVDFLEPFVTHPQTRKAETSNIVKYIKSQWGKGELTDWTVVAVSSSIGDDYSLLAEKIGLVTRNEQEEKNDDRYVLKKNHLISQTHEYLDFTYDGEKEKIERALEETIKGWEKKKSKKEKPTKPSGHYIREQREKEKALLLLYFLDPNKVTIKGEKFTKIPFVGYAISFPATPNAEEIEYMVDTTYWRQLYGEDID